MNRSLNLSALVLIVSILFFASAASAQQNYYDRPIGGYLNLKSETGYDIMFLTMSPEDIEEGLLDEMLAELQENDELLEVVVVEAGDAVHVELLLQPGDIFEMGGGLNAVDGNGEVISANPYISTDTEK